MDLVEEVAQIGNWMYVAKESELKTDKVRVLPCNEHSEKWRDGQELSLNLGLTMHLPHSIQVSKAHVLFYFTLD